MEHFKITFGVIILLFLFLLLHMLHQLDVPPPRISSYCIFLRWLCCLFDSNPLISWWLYCTAESIFAGNQGNKRLYLPLSGADPPLAHLLPGRTSTDSGAETLSTQRRWGTECFEDFPSDFHLLKKFFFVLLPCRPSSYVIAAALLVRIISQELKK